MSTNTNTSPELDTILYDTLMGVIEPDLTTNNFPTLDAKYAEETKEEHEARMDRYAQAKEKFDVRLKKFTEDSERILGNMKKEAMTLIQTEEAKQDNAAIKNIEDSF